MECKVHKNFERFEQKVLQSMCADSDFFMDFIVASLVFAPTCNSIGATWAPWRMKICDDRKEDGWSWKKSEVHVVDAYQIMGILQPRVWFGNRYICRVTDEFLYICIVWACFELICPTLLLSFLKCIWEGLAVPIWEPLMKPRAKFQYLFIVLCHLRFYFPLQIGYRFVPL